MTSNQSIAGMACAGAVLAIFVIAFWGSLKPTPPVEEGLEIRQVSFSDLKGWAEAEKEDALSAFLQSCKRWDGGDPTRSMAPKVVDADIKALFGSLSHWQALCVAARDMSDGSTKNTVQFFESHFVPVLIKEKGDKSALFTGYYEPQLQGSLTPRGAYNTPLLKRPDDLVMVDLGAFRKDLAGRRIAGRVSGGRLTPFESRAELEAMDAHDPEEVLVWVDDPVDAFFLHIQGSGRVVLPDGKTLRVGYDGQNGHPYTAIGRVLREQGALAPDNISLQTIKAWLAENAEQADDIMNTNASYVFFRGLEVDDPNLGPLGAQSVPLTPEASIAVDTRYYGLGAPVWLDFEMAVPGGQSGANAENKTVFNFLTVAQDTGGAIKGAQRADLFWGFGDRAEQIAGIMQARGFMYVLIPRELAPE